MEITRPVSHQDFFATMADLAGVELETDPGLPRDSMSFADSIGWSDNELPAREFTVSNVAPHERLLQEVALCDGVHKLIVPAGLRGLATIGGNSPGSRDRFYHIDDETTNLASLDNEEYLRFREAITDYWPSAVGTALPNQLEIFADVVASIDSENVTDMHSADRRVGHVAQTEPVSSYESRVLIKFKSNTILQALQNANKTSNQIRKAELILRFGHDSGLLGNLTNDDPHYLQFDADTTPINVHPLLVPWSESTRWNDIRQGYAAHIELGSLDLAPHIVHQDLDDHLSSVPIERGTPLSFGRRSLWTSVIRNWTRNPSLNHGIMLKSDAIPGLTSGDQNVSFRAERASDVRLRITFDE
jgi:hypothetical protein